MLEKPPGYKKVECPVQRRASNADGFVKSFPLQFSGTLYCISYLNHYDIDETTVKEIKTDEISLLEFGMKWLKWLLFKEGDFKMS